MHEKVVEILIEAVSEHFDGDANSTIIEGACEQAIASLANTELNVEGADEDAVIKAVTDATVSKFKDMIISIVSTVLDYHKNCS